MIIFADQVFIDATYTFFGVFVCGPLWLTFVLYEFLGRRCFIDPICCNSCMVLSMFFRLVLANSLFFLCETSTWHLDSCPRKTRGMAWFCGCWEFWVGVWNQSARIFFFRVFSGCCAILTSPKKGETDVYGYNPALFWVLSVSCWCLAELIFT